MKQQLLVLCGISGSSKSTWAREYIKTNPGFVRTNRDDMRRQLVGVLTQDYYKRGNVKQLEGYITTLLDEQIRLFLSKGLNVIVDNTHLDKKYLLHYFEDFWDVEVSVKYFDIDLKDAIERVKLRDGDINTEYIVKQFNQYQEVKRAVIDPYVIKPVHLHGYNKKAIIVDIDGTIADCKDVRSPYDGDKCHLDRVIEETRLVVKAMRGNWLKRFFNPVKVVYLSGREQKWYDKTERWLKDNDFPSGPLFMRTTGDPRSDWKVKYEIFKSRVAPKYYPLFAIDDRHQVIRLWNKLGIFVFNTNQTLEIF